MIGERNENEENSLAEKGPARLFGFWLDQRLIKPAKVTSQALSWPRRPGKQARQEL